MPPVPPRVRLAAERLAAERLAGVVARRDARAAAVLWRARGVAPAAGGGVIALGASRSGVSAGAVAAGSVAAEGADFAGAAVAGMVRGVAAGCVGAPLAPLGRDLTTTVMRRLLSSIDACHRAGYSDSASLADREHSTVRALRLDPRWNPAITQMQDAS